jgi:3-methylcrotonyl-CoA carboxylase alpha subunit
MFRKILIANRGEIACRVMATASRLNIRTVAVYSAADANARHVKLADEAYLLGPAEAAMSYLSIERILDAAKRSGAEAIHPGYGFLSENEEFAEACARAGVVFIGPPAAAIRAMGLKSAAKILMEKAGVPVVPGYSGDNQDLAHLEREAKRIGWPVLLKPIAGGGGKGMRRVNEGEDFAAAVASAQREGQSAFGDPRLLIEKYLEKSRHVEIQIMADAHGNVLHFFERDCSAQRRHQKIIEEAPAPGLSAKMRKAMGDAAVAAARAVDYVGAGTIEFLVDASAPAAAPDKFYFMEMNTRLQVEHPVTEMITGHDLVHWQFKVAAGERIDLKQSDLAVQGHAVEARIYAEDPQNRFLPSIGRLLRMKTPETGPDLRIDTGVAEGDEVTPYYDPMIAKMIAHGPDRATAIQRLIDALGEFQVAGVNTNIAFLARILENPAFRDGGPNSTFIGTTFIDTHLAELLVDDDRRSVPTLALAALGTLLWREVAARAAAASSVEPWSPWNNTGAWRLNHAGQESLRWRDGDGEIAVGVEFQKDGYQLTLPGGVVSAQGSLDAQGYLSATLDGQPVAAGILVDGLRIAVMQGGRTRWFDRRDPLGELAGAVEGASRIVAPMPGKIIQVLVAAGANVVKGQPLVVMEAMKMEHTIAAPMDGAVDKVLAGVGDQVNEGAMLVAYVEESKEAKENLLD